MAQDTLAPWAESVPGQVGLATSADLWGMPEDGWHYELVEGRLVRMAPTGMEHANIELALGSELRQFVRTHRLGRVFSGEVGFALNVPGEPETVLGADLAFVQSDRLPPPGSPDWRGFGQLAPDLAVEIASPSQSGPQLAAKAQRWLAAGTRVVWIVWPQSSRVDVWSAGASEPVAVQGEGAMLDGGNVLPGFALPLTEVFAPD